MKPEVLKLVILIIQCVLALGLNAIVAFLYYTAWHKEEEVYNKVNATLNSTCVKFYEISEPVREFLYWSYLPQFPDKLLTFTGLIAFKLFQDPFGIVYNTVMYHFLADKQENLIANLTFCGHPVQNEIKEIPMLLKEARSAHFNIALLTAAAVIFNIIWNSMEWILECIKKRKENRAAGGALGASTSKQAAKK